MTASTIPLFATDPRPWWQRERIRPTHYVIVSRYPLDDDFWDGLEPDCADDEHGYIGIPADHPRQADDDDACWDNWIGRWVVTTDWSDSLDLIAEGYARYDLRPQEKTA